MGSGTRQKESVWDYPRPPLLEADTRHVRVEFAGETIASTNGAYRVLETSHPPSYYIPSGDVNFNFLVGTDKQSFCEWKGAAEYWTVKVACKSPTTRAGVIPSRANALPPSKTTCRSTRATCTPVTSAMKRCKPKTATSMAAGSHQKSKARSKAAPAPGVGNRNQSLEILRATTK